MAGKTKPTLKKGPIQVGDIFFYKDQPVGSFVRYLWGGKVVEVISRLDYGKSIEVTFIELEHGFTYRLENITQASFRLEAIQFISTFWKLPLDQAESR